MVIVCHYLTFFVLCSVCCREVVTQIVLVQGYWLEVPTVGIFQLNCKENMAMESGILYQQYFKQS